MTNNRKIALFDELLNYIYEVINNDGEYIDTLGRLGFSRDELDEMRDDM